MAEPLARPRVTPEEYLAFERAAPERHELIDGEIVAMSGGTREHSLLGVNLIIELGTALRNSTCEVHGADFRVKVEASDCYTYPDVTVVCARPELEDEHGDTLLNPTALFEVLSDSTERYDRGEKFAQYRTIPTLTDYVLVSQKAIAIEHYHRQPQGGWLLRTYGPGQSFRLEALGCELTVDEVYRRVLVSELGR